MLSLRMIPDRMVRRRSRLQLGPTEARLLAHADVSRVGAVQRGQGFSRADFASGQSTTVTSAGVLVRRDGKPVLIYATAGGVWGMHPNPSSAYEESDFA